MKVTIIVEHPDGNIEVIERPRVFGTPTDVLLDRAIARVRAALGEEGASE